MNKFLLIVHKFDLKKLFFIIKNIEILLSYNILSPPLLHSLIMKSCSACGQFGHNKRTCSLKTCDSPPSEIRAAKALAALLPPPNKSRKVSKPLEDISSCQNIWKEPKEFYAKEKSRENICSICGCKGHNSRTCSASSPGKAASGRQCSLCGECGHNKRTCHIKESHSCLEIKDIFDKAMEKLKPPKRVITCSLCKGKDHNSRTCPMKCRPCSDQMVRSYCFSGMSASQAVTMARILGCESIYGETEEYPQFVESPPAQRKTECITFANGETIALDLGTV